MLKIAHWLCFRSSLFEGQLGWIQNFCFIYSFIEFLKTEVPLLPCFLCFEKSDIFIWHFACMSWRSYLHIWNWIVLARICLRIDWCGLTLPGNFLSSFNVYIWVSFYISGKFSGIRVLNINSVPLCFFLFQWLWLYVCYSFFACLLFHCFPSDPFHFFLYVIFISWLLSCISWMYLLIFIWVDSPLSILMHCCIYSL